MDISRRSVFFVSDSTAITAETLGHCLLAQFDHIKYDPITFPFIDTVEKAEKLVHQINIEAANTGLAPIVFSTLVSKEIRDKVKKSRGIFLDLFDTYLETLERELSVPSSHIVGRYHSLSDVNSYDVRIDAINYALGADDGTGTKEYDRADVILIGVSRAGKTPTCLYLGMQFGIYAANYPLTEEDLLGRRGEMPAVLLPFRPKLYGLTINPERLQKIRSQRRPNSRYASFSQCRLEVEAAEAFFEKWSIPYLNVTTMSVEEIASKVLHETNLGRRVW
ncbi:MAG TPA: pyruvate, water dikinase regulatory protein [Syntrophales bacterium]|nr:pyruvate, water dikinase regulatory protein [Syntrophales bacterium]HOL59802.1 pyruvate, water dikinase regulatory protein [Syntrophales bacterium]HPO35980.1 pyruvate, water dikinase regulatory protein [Syntrophales bacterium]